jgi:hypothetical protein
MYIKNKKKLIIFNAVSYVCVYLRHGFPGEHALVDDARPAKQQEVTGDLTQILQHEVSFRVDRFFFVQHTKWP